MQAHIEVLDELSVVDEPVKEEDRVVHLLASLPDTYNVLVTALEASAEVPKMEVVTERLLHEERKLKTRSISSGTSIGDEEAMAAKYQGYGRLRCHFCKKVGHIKRNCDEFAKLMQEKKPRQGAYKAAAREDNFDTESIAAALWGGRWRSQHVCFHSDNMAVVAIMASRTAGTPLLMHLLRCFSFYCAYHGFHYTCVHIPGVLNVAADTLSRNNLPLFFSLVPQVLQFTIPTVLVELLVTSQPTGDQPPGLSCSPRC